MMDIDSTALATLVAVVQEGTFDAAAARLHITPSAVSQRIKTLETAIGRVVVRRTKPCRATTDGEVLLRLARQWEWLTAEATSSLAAEPGRPDGPRIHLPIAANADSLAIWLLPVIGDMQRRHPVAIEVLRGDESLTAGFLRSGEVLGAITSDRTHVRGCAMVTLGRMRYIPVATKEFIARWFADGVTAEHFDRAPLVSFDRTDTIQRDLIAAITGRAGSPPTTYIPASTEYHHAVEAGIGWGAVPVSQISAALTSGGVQILSESYIDVELYWQFWTLRSPMIDDLTELITSAARTALADQELPALAPTPSHRRKRPRATDD